MQFRRDVRESQMTTQKYRDDSRGLLAQARTELDAGDLRQASEKGWGAAALMIKAIAEGRGNDWEIFRHRHFSRAASRLRSELGNRDVTRLFNVAESLHGNFYEDQLRPEDVSESLDDVERLLDLLEPIAQA